MFSAWTDIEGLHQVVQAYRLGNERAGYPLPKVTYRGKIKLDGTNAGVRIEPDGRVVAQSRTTDITVTNDNCGFAAWVLQNEEYFRGLQSPVGGTVVIYGEWCGKGIQKGCAIQQVSGRYFVVFAIQETQGEETRLLVEPYRIMYASFAKGTAPEAVHILPWATEEFTIDFADQADLEAKANEINELVLKLEPCDLWVKEVFGVEGVCEGLVYYPITEAVRDGSMEKRDAITRPMFKAKGEKHRVKVAKTAVQVDPDVLASIEEFVSAFVTEPRCEQGVTNSGAIEMKNVGSFLKWLCVDVEKESKAELEASGLEWKQVSTAVQRAARDWYLAKARSI